MLLPGATPLYISTAIGPVNERVEEYTLILKELIRAGADVNAANHSSFFPLYSAAQNGHLEMVECLLQVLVPFARCTCNTAALTQHIVLPGGREPEQDHQKWRDSSLHCG